MAVTVKNETQGYISLPRPFMTTLAAGASATVTGIYLDSIEAGNLARLQTMANAGDIVITETDETLQRGTVADASVADVHQLLNIGQATAGNGSVDTVAVIERQCTLQNITCWFDAVPAATETITITLTRNGQSVLNAAFVVNDSSTLPSESGVGLAGFADKTDGAVLASDPDEFNSAGVTFTAAMVGNILLLNSGGTNDGAYIIDGYTDANNVDCTNLDGTDPAFTNESGIEWDMILAFQPGDIIVLAATVANTTNLGYWACQAVFEPR